MEMKKSSNLSVDPEKFENIHQVGGIRTGTLDWPDAGGAAGCRVALVNTGSPLRFSVAVDRGGDIVEAFYGHTSLAYLTPNGFRPPSPMLHRDEEWLRNWPGGLVTSCGPRYIGPGREEDGQQLYLHGPFSNTTAALVALHNPDVRAGDSEISLEMVIRDTRLYGPVVEVRRRWSCRLGQPEIRLEDRVNNRGNTRVAHNWLYHINLGYPLLDEGAEFVYSGRVNGGWEMGPNLSMAELSRDERDFSRFLRVPGPLPDHVGTNSQGLVLDVDADSQGVARVGLVNPRLQLAFSIEYRRESLPRLANWQHYGPAGDYVSALEPFSGSLFGKDEDRHPQAAQWLEPGESKVYQLTIRVLESPAAVESFRSQRGELISDL